MVKNYLLGWTSILLCINGTLRGQFTQSTTLDILAGLEDSTIQVVVEPPITVGNTENIFDGNPYTNIGVQESDLVRITLHFEEAIDINKSNIFFWHDGLWSLEIAMTEDDLNTQSGSYQQLVNNDDFFYFEWDSVSFCSTDVHFVSLVARNPGDNNIFLGEWTLFTTITYISLQILPDSLKLVPETSMQLNVEVVDVDGNTHPFEMDEVIFWSSSDVSVATVDEMGRIFGVSLGISEITATTQSLSGYTTVQVVDDFESVNAEPIIIRVALILQDPMTDNNELLHERFGWLDPNILVDQLLEEFYQASDAVIQFQIMETDNDSTLFTRLDGEFLLVDELVEYYSEPGWPELVQAHQEGLLEFDYLAMLEYYDLCEKRNNGVIDEVWVYSHPYSAMYESLLTGPDAFWWNSPPLEGSTCELLLSIMGWNYERGVDMAMHSFGHRVESAISHVYGRWDMSNEEPNNWELFTRIDQDFLGDAQIGNVHYPPNGISDYDVSNTNYVVTYADNWKRYPILLDQSREVNCQEWNCSEIGYQRWWLNHLPRFTGVTDGILNNWWHYIVDYEGAEEASLSIISDPVDESDNIIPEGLVLYQNYPNPFNPITTINFTLTHGGYVELVVFDILGREVEKLMSGKVVKGEHEAIWDARDAYSGIYFYRLSYLNSHQQSILTKKMVVMK